LAFSGYFLTPSGPGPVEAVTEVLRVGRTMSTGQVSISQPGGDGVQVERMRALASFGDLDASATVLQTAPPPDMPPPEECLSSAEAPEFLAAATLLERIDIRLDPATAGWVAGAPSGRGEMRGWLRLLDGREPDPLMLLFALDALPPVAFNLGILGWAPTLEFTGHVRGRPAPGWLRVSLTSQNVTAGLMEEDATVWDSEGRFVAQSRQLCGIRTPSPAN
jgi:acyl-CoA thioesterase